jgi:hypothetical protein
MPAIEVTVSCHAGWWNESEDLFKWNNDARQTPTKSYAGDFLVSKSICACETFPRIWHVKLCQVKCSNLLPVTTTTFTVDKYGQEESSKWRP